MNVDIEAMIGSVVTVSSAAAFVAIVAWAWSARRKRAFDDAANAPFALPDDGGTAVPSRAKDRP